MMVDQCNACPEHGIVFVGGRWWCGEHMLNGFAFELDRIGRIVEAVDTEPVP